MKQETDSFASVLTGIVESIGPKQIRPATETVIILSLYMITSTIVKMTMTVFNYKAGRACIYVEFKKKV